MNGGEIPHFFNKISLVAKFFICIFAYTIKQHNTMAASKTFKIGEYCKGGVITVEIQGKIITVIGKEWDTSAGFKKSSNQSNAKEFTRGTVLSDEDNVEWKLTMFLNDLTTSYYADEIMKWIKSKIKLKERLFW